MPANIAPFESALLPLQVIAVLRPTHGGVSNAVLVREAQGRVTSVGDGGDRLAVEDWAYYADRVVDGQGGNGITYELAAFRTSSISEAAEIASCWFNEATRQRFGSIMEFCGLVSAFGHLHDGSASAVPFHLLLDDRGRLHAVVLDKGHIDRFRIGSTYLSRARWSTYRSTTHTSHDGWPGWRLAGTGPVWLGFGADEVEVDLNGRSARADQGRPAE